MNSADARCASTKPNPVKNAVAVVVAVDAAEIVVAAVAVIAVAVVIAGKQFAPTNIPHSGNPATGCRFFVPAQNGTDRPSGRIIGSHKATESE